MTTRTYSVGDREYTAIRHADRDVVIYSKDAILIDMIMKSEQQIKLVNQVSRDHKLGFLVYKNKHGITRVKRGDEYMNYSPSMVLSR